MMTTAPADDSSPRQGSSAPRSRAPLVLVMVLAGLFALGIGLGQALHLQLPHFGLDGLSSTAAPAQLTIPSVDVHARVVAVGQAGDGSIDVPTQDPARTAGWYRLGPTPGDAGTAVIVGHVDTKTEAAVFYKLPDLASGDKIEVTRRDGHVSTFAVDRVEKTPKNAFPATTIFAPAAKPRLVLVTCGGDWVGGDLGYADNVIVFATLVG